MHRQSREPREVPVKPHLSPALLNQPPMNLTVGLVALTHRRLDCQPNSWRWPRQPFLQRPRACAIPLPLLSLPATLIGTRQNGNEYANHP